MRTSGRPQIFEAANLYAERMLPVRKQYAAWAGLELPGRQVAELEAKRASLDRASSCVMSIGWGGGLLSKTSWIDMDQDREQCNQILRNVPLYRKAIECSPRRGVLCCRADSGAKAPDCEDRLTCFGVS